LARARKPKPPSPIAITSSKGQNTTAVRELIENLATPLREFLDQHRLRARNPDAGIMFVSRKKTPLCRYNLLNDQILRC
jgi:hypothetical protein